MCDDKSFVRSAALRVYKGPSGAGKTEIPARTANRYRDVVLNPNGRTIYIATDNAGRTTGRDGLASMTQELEHPGAIIQFTYGDQP